MTISLQQRLNIRTQVFKALAHPSRLIIVEALSTHSRCVSELTDLIGSDVSTVSRHLSVLKNAGVVRDEKRKLQVYYSLAMPCVLGFFSCIEQVAHESAESDLNLTRESIEH